MATDSDYRPRCWNCGHMLAEMLTRPWFKRCERCKKNNGCEPEGGEPTLTVMLHNQLTRAAEVYLMALAAEKAAGA